MDLREIGWGWIGFDWLRIGTSFCEFGGEPSGSSATELVSYLAVKYHIRLRFKACRASNYTLTILFILS
jgi:hypothetical protein